IYWFPGSAWEPNARGPASMAVSRWPVREAEPRAWRSQAEPGNEGKLRRSVSPSHPVILFLRLRHARPVVRAKRRRRNAFLVEEVDHRAIGPSVTHGNRLGHVRARNHDVIADNLRIGVDELVVVAGDREAGQLAVLGDEAAADVLEAEERLFSLNLHLVEDRTRIDQLLIAISDGTRRQCQPTADRLLLLGMD